VTAGARARRHGAAVLSVAQQLRSAVCQAHTRSGHAGRCPDLPPPNGVAACTLDGGNPPPRAPQVNVGEDEPEDIAVRKFMKKVMESGIIDEVRGREGGGVRVAEWGGGGGRCAPAFGVPLTRSTTQLADAPGACAIACMMRCRRGGRVRVHRCAGAPIVDADAVPSPAPSRATHTHAQTHTSSLAQRRCATGGTRRRRSWSTSAGPRSASPRASVCGGWRGRAP